jgi:hypothetical protein
MKLQASLKTFLANPTESKLTKKGPQETSSALDHDAPK